VTRATKRELVLDDKGRDVLKYALLGLELIFRAEVVGLIIRDERGTSVVPQLGAGPRDKPGTELELFRWLADINWESALRVVEEQR
jgi:hypothetical protein